MTVRLTDLHRRKLETEEGAELGRIVDLVVRLDGIEPRVVRLRVRRGRTTLEIETAFVRAPEEEPLIGLPGKLEAPKLADDELLLERHVLDAQIVDLAGRRVTRVGDVELEGLTVSGVCIGLGPVLERLGLRGLARHAMTETVLWRNLHLTSRRGHVLMLDSPATAIHRAPPDALSHLVAHLPHRRAHEVLQAVDPGTAEAAMRSPSPRPRRFPFRWIRRHAAP
jgi:sporulation protein YlmC with PRC-barrel domain